MPGLSGLPFSAESRVMAGDTVGMRSRLSQAYVATKLSDVTDLNARAAGAAVLALRLGRQATPRQIGG